MPYSLNPHLPRLRARAVDMVQQGKGIREVARYIGVEPSTVSRWVKKVPPTGAWIIPTRSSRPHHPQEISRKIEDRIKDLRIQTGGRCAEVIHQMLLNEGTSVSLSTVKRTLDRCGLTKKKHPRKIYHQSGERPKAASPGHLIQVDTVHLYRPGADTIYLYTLIDVYSRWAYVWSSARITSWMSVRFLQMAQQAAPFTFQCVQSDNGSEFSRHFTERIHIRHRHSRVRKPNDNAHLERFNRTIQQELLPQVAVLEVRKINRCLPRYLRYYNEERLHLGIHLKTPSQMLT